jgi:DNA-binding response OmpR family regulator
VDFLGRPRILIVEDEWLIAEALQETLREAGYIVCGPVSRAKDAVALVGDGGIDGAVLDVSLRGENSFGIARLLVDKAIPFVFMTGYVTGDFPQDFRGRPLLNKPIDSEKLIASVERMVGTVRGNREDRA